MNVIRKFLSSRKFWAFLVGAVTLIGGAFEDGAFTAQEVQAVSALIIGYIFSVAWEDGKHAEAAGNVNAAAVTATTQANTTTVTTPGESDVTVTAPTEKPAPARVGLTGLEG